MLRWRTTADHLHTVIIWGQMLCSQSMICVVYILASILEKLIAFFRRCPNRFGCAYSLLIAYSFLTRETAALTQTVTQTRKETNSSRRRQWTPHRAERPQKCRKTLYLSAFRHPSNLHTQEVTGSSPAVSTKKFLISPEIRNFFAYLA